MTRRELNGIYFEAWTADGVTEAHTDVDAICCWLCDESLRTEADRERLGDLKAMDIIKMATEIADMVRESLK